jgi:plasmid stabilization system protein ParE
MPEVIWLLQALRDVDRLYRFLLEKNPQAAQRAAETIFNAADPLKAFPDIGTSVPDKPAFRDIYAAYGHSSYVIRYTQSRNGSVLITRVWHGKEKGRFV